MISEDAKPKRDEDRDAAAWAEIEAKYRQARMGVEVLEKVADRVRSVVALRIELYAGRICLARFRRRVSY